MDDARGKLNTLIKDAFSGVTLGAGISARQSEVIDNHGKGFTRSEFDRIPLGEVTDDWSLVSVSELDRILVPHLDDEGFRYYLPALMLSLMDDYESGSMRAIGTLRGLYPRANSREDCIQRFAILDSRQKNAVATWLAHLDQLVPLGSEDAKVVPRALKAYWSAFVLPSW